MGYVVRKIDPQVEETILARAKEAEIPADSLNQFLKYIAENWDTYFNNDGKVSAEDYAKALAKIEELESDNEYLRQRLEETERALERLRENSEKLLAVEEQLKLEREKLEAMREEKEKDRELKKLLKVADLLIAREKEKFKIVKEYVKERPDIIDLESMTRELFDDTRVIKLVSGKVEDLQALPKVESTEKQPVNLHIGGKAAAAQ